MASEKLNRHIVIFEAANYRGSPKQFSGLAEKIKKSFPEAGREKLSSALAHAPKMRHAVNYSAVYSSSLSNALN